MSLPTLDMLPFALTDYNEDLSPQEAANVESLGGPPADFARRESRGVAAVRGWSNVFDGEDASEVSPRRRNRSGGVDGEDDGHGEDDEEEEDGGFLSGVCVTLENDCERLVELLGSGSYWLDPQDDPRCTLERLAMAIFRFHADTSPVLESSEMLGVEWWVQVRRSEWKSMADIPLHWDCDEELKKLTGEHVPPWLASVTYVGDAGAPTIVLPVPADSCGRAMAPLTETLGSFVSYPKRGKHMAFDGRLLHGALKDMAVSSAAGDVSGAEETDYMRVSILVNIWVGRKPHGIDRLPAEAAADLSNASGDFFKSAVPVDALSVSSLAPGAGVSVSPESREFPVRTLVQKELLEATPNWKELARTIGFPFSHRPVGLRNLPVITPGTEPPSLVHLPGLAVEVQVQSQ
jgi:hypothetical protein